MGFGTSADFQDAVRAKVARLNQVKDILEENDEEATKERANEVLKLHNKFERFRADKEYRLDAYKEV